MKILSEEIIGFGAVPRAYQRLCFFNAFQGTGEQDILAEIKYAPLSGTAERVPNSRW